MMITGGNINDTTMMTAVLEDIRVPRDGKGRPRTRPDRVLPTTMHAVSTLKPKNIVVLGRGVGLATLAPLSQLAAEQKVGVTAILSARHAGVVMSQDLFAGLGARVMTVLDTDNSSAVENVEKIVEGLIAQGKADAFFTCGSNRLLKLMQRLGKKHNIPGQVAMEQIMVCGFGACYVCMRTFMVDGEKVLRRVCRDGPVFNMQEAVGW